MKQIKFVRLSKYAKSPVKESIFSAGWDIFAAYNTIVPKFGKALVLTDIAIQIPFGYYGRLAARSGLGLIYNISVNAGVIDSNYRGGIGVCLVNHSNEDFYVTAGMRCAQLIIEKYLANAMLVEVESLDASDRNHRGFGSSGLYEMENNFAINLSLKDN